MTPEVKVNARLREKYRLNPEKARARDEFKYAIKVEKIERLPCEVCGNVKSEAHHTDYSKPYDVKWLCRIHHGEAERITF